MTDEQRREKLESELKTLQERQTRSMAGLEKLANTEMDPGTMRDIRESQLKILASIAGDIEKKKAEMAQFVARIQEKKEAREATKKQVGQLHVEELIARLEEQKAALPDLQKKYAEAGNNLAAAMGKENTSLMEQEFSALSPKIRAVQEEIPLLEAEIQRRKDQAAADALETRRQERKQPKAGQAEDKKEEEDVYQGRFHPLLPTPEQIQADPSLLYSDHVPEVVQCGKYRIIMMNLYNPSQPSGFDPHGKEGNEERAERLIAALVRMVVEQKADSICTQEFWLSAEKLHQLQAALAKETGNAWTAQGEGNTLYFSKLAVKDTNKALQEAMDAHFEGTDLYKQLAQPKPQIAEHPDCIVVNVHINHQERPDAHEAFLRAYLSVLQKKTKKPIYLLGDPNIRVVNQARVARKEFAVTSVAPPAFRQTEALPNGVQGVDYGHLALVCHLDGKIEQLVSQVIEPHTGKIFVLPENPQHLTPLQKQEAKEFRPALTLGTRYEQAFSIMGDFSIQAYNKFLQTYFGEHVSVCIAVNTFSEVGLTLIAPKEVYDAIYDSIPKDNPSYPLQFRTIPPMGIGGEQLHVPLPYAGLLHEQLMRAYVEVYKPKQDEEASTAAPPQKKSVLGAFFNKGNIQKPASLPTYNFQPTEIIPKALLAFQEALAAPDAAQLDALKKQIEDYAKEEEGSHFVHLYANLLLAEYLLIPDGKTPEQLESDTKLAQAHLTEVEKSPAKQNAFLARQEQSVLHMLMEKLSHADVQSAAVEMQIGKIGMLLPSPPERPAAAAAMQRK